MEKRMEQPHSVSLQRHPSLYFMLLSFVILSLFFHLLYQHFLLPLPLSFPVSLPLHHSLHNFTSALHHSLLSLPLSDILLSLALSYANTAMAQCRDH